MSASLRDEILARLDGQDQERRDIAQARRLLRKRGLQLHIRGGRCSVVDHLGVINGAPENGPVVGVLAWIEATEASR